MSDPCLICGAGPTGLVLAIELKRFGIPVRLIDKSDHAAKWSQALVVQARTLEQFERYGIADEVVAKGLRTQTANFHSNGKQIASLDLARIPSRFNFFLLLPQSETERLLTNHLSSLGVEIERGVELTGFEQAEGKREVAATLRHADGRIENASFRWLAGCDGAHSKVRSEMKVPFEGDTVGMQFLLADLHLTGKDAPGNEVVVYLRHGGDVLFMVKLTGETHRVILALHDQQTKHGHEGTRDEQAPQQMPELKDFNAAFELYGLDIHADASTWLAPFHINQRKARYYRDGNVFLAGDASHIHSPVGGQGMNTGIQDAANLAWKLAAVSRGADDRLLDSYNEERGKVGDALLRGTSGGLAAVTTPNPLFETVRDFVLRKATHIESVCNALAATISETSITYRDSTAVHDSALGGALKAGDRLPDTTQAFSQKELLNKWKTGDHLLLAVNVPQQEVPRNLRFTSVVELPEAAEEVFGKGPMVYIVRPDGYIGFRGALREPMQKYAASIGLL